MNNVIVITGSRGVGKSTLAATYLGPGDVDKVFVHDSENSMNNIREQLQAAGLDFGHYVNLESRFADANPPSEDDLLSAMNQGNFPWVTASQKTSLMNYYEYILDDLARNLTKGKYKVYIHDTLSKFEAGMVAWVEEHKQELGLMPKPYEWGKFWVSGVYSVYQNLLEAVFARGVETVILCSHLKDATEKRGKKTVKIVGKVIPRGKPMLYQISSLMLWLIRDRQNADGSPAALVLKERMGKLSVVDGNWEIKRTLPERLPSASWKNINDYLSGRASCDLSNPREGEAMTRTEREMISELVSEEQMKLMILSEERELLEVKAQMPDILRITDSTTFKPPSIEVEVTTTEGKTAPELLREGMSAVDVSKALEVPLPLVLAEQKRIEAEEDDG